MADGLDRMVIYVPAGRKARIEAFAKTQGYPIPSDYVRMLIEKDMKHKGEDIDLAVNRGGDRRGTSAGDDGDT